MMRRKLLLSVVVMLLLCSGAYAAVGQAEGFSINAFNTVGRFGLIGSAEGSNITMVGHSQETHDVFSGTSALQNETAILTQSASAAGRGGAGIVDQQANAGGSQGQMAGFGARTQGQALNVSLDSFNGNFGGIGGGIGAQAFVGSQNQLEITPSGMSSSAQFIGAAQFNAVSGGPWSNTTVNNGLDVNLTQGSTVSGWPMR